MAIETVFKQSVEKRGLAIHHWPVVVNCIHTCSIHTNSSLPNRVKPIIHKTFADFKKGQFKNRIIKRLALAATCTSCLNNSNGVQFIHVALAVEHQIMIPSQCASFKALLIFDKSLPFYLAGKSLRGNRR